LGDENASTPVNGQPPIAQNNEDLLRDIFGSSTTPSAPGASSPPQTQRTTVDDILGLFGSTTTTAYHPVPPASAPAGSAFSLPQSQSQSPPPAAATATAPAPAPPISRAGDPAPDIVYRLRQERAEDHTDTADIACAAWRRHDPGAVPGVWLDASDGVELPGCRAQGEIYFLSSYPFFHLLLVTTAADAAYVESEC